MTSHRPSASSLVALLFLSVVALLPFERLPSFQVHGYTVKLSYLAALAVLALIPFSGWLKKLREGGLTLSDKFLGGLFLAGAAATAFSPSKGRSLVIVALWAFVFLMYQVAGRMFRDARLRERAENILLWVTLLICLFGLYQFVGDSWGLSQDLTGLRLQYTKIVLGFPRIQSVALEPLYFSNYLLVPFFLVAYRFLVRKGSAMANFLLSTLILTEIILGISRGAYLALLGGGLVLAAYLLIRRKDYKQALPRLGGLFGSFALSLVLSVAMIYGFDGMKAGSNYFLHVNASDSDTISATSVPGRVEVYRTAFRVFKEEPVLGSGLGSFGVKTATSPEEIKQFGYGIVNNEYLEILAETGVVGLLAFGGFFLAFAGEILAGWKQAGAEKRLQIVAIAAGILGILIQYNFFSTLYILYIWIFLGYLRALGAKKPVS